MGWAEKVNKEYYIDVTLLKQIDPLCSLAVMTTISAIKGVSDWCATKLSFSCTCQQNNQHRPSYPLLLTTPKCDPVCVHVNRIYSWIFQPFSLRLLPGSVNISGLIWSCSSFLIKGLSEAAQPGFMMPWRRQSAPHITHLFSGINHRSFMVIPGEKPCTGAIKSSWYDRTRN